MGFSAIEWGCVGAFANVRAKWVSTTIDLKKSNPFPKHCKNAAIGFVGGVVFYNGCRMCEYYNVDKASTFAIATAAYTNVWFRLRTTGTPVQCVGIGIVFGGIVYVGTKLWLRMETNVTNQLKNSQDPL